MLSDLTYLRLDIEHRSLHDRSRTSLDVTAAKNIPDLDSEHPIQSLPFELVSLIFLHCLPKREQLHPLTAPLLLTRVCGTWRAIALRTPKLWCSVFFELFNVPPGLLPSKIQMLEYWLAQGAAHPLTMHLHYRQPFEDVVPLISAQSKRWEDVDLFLHPSTLAAFSSAKLQLPVLRRLSFGCLPLRDTASSLHITAFSNAPQLADVSLLKLPPSAVALPWAQLTRFYCQSADLPDVLGVLHLAPALQHLRLDLQEATPLDADYEPCVHAALVELIIHAHPAAAVPVCALLAPLTLPALRTLELPPIGAPDIAPLAAFVTRSKLGRILRRLALPLAPLDPGDILAALRPLQALEGLELHYPSEAPLLDILHALTNHDAENDSAFLPELRAVYIDCFRAAVPYCALLAVLEARYSDDAGEGTVQLDSFVMTAMAPSVPEPAHLLALRLLKTHGMDISISHVFGGSVV
ncbi:hypothetical protein C8F04DRAFT_958238 [Mycena alexandri]|uniref:F-box domain-containing protein n=1 Tax=Mycena alexandri TaxID=1745969 RepID=A0AAD6SV43_9AGAR|nr:hypothetical protein C8F04DRAFT_958238 [Mycena alexandri]